MDQSPSLSIASFDGTPLAVHRMGQGRPVVLLHGLFSSAQMNWIKYGHAATLAQGGFEVFMPDLRAHGQSGAPHDPQNYPGDVLVRDLKAVISGLGLTDYDLAGFSLGARTSVAGVVAGLTPRKLALCGMGLEGLAGWQKRADFFIDVIDNHDTIKRGDPRFVAANFMKLMQIDRVAARLLLGAVADVAQDDLANVTMPTAVINGVDDRDNGSPDALVEALPNASLIEIPGTHMSCVVESALGDALLRFLAP